MSRIIRQFELLEQIGTGSMGIIWRAVQTTLDRPVAVKELHPLLARDPEFLARFEREAKTAGTLQHENIVGVIDYGKEDNTYFLALEFVDGVNLEELLDAAGGELPVSIVLTIARDVLRGLSHAHERSITHRDIKPANIMLTSAGMAKVGDFSIAQAAAMPTITQTGAMMGTPAYMSPEQVGGRPLTGQTDLFSLGVIMHELLAGERPFGGNTYPEIIANLLNETPKDLHELDPRIPQSLATIVTRALEKGTEARYANADEFLQDLERVAMDEAIGMGRHLVGLFQHDPAAAAQEIRNREVQASIAGAAQADSARRARLLARAKVLDPAHPDLANVSANTKAAPAASGPRYKFLAGFGLSIAVVLLIAAAAVWKFGEFSPGQPTPTALAQATPTTAATQATTVRTHVPPPTRKRRVRQPTPQPSAARSPVTVVIAHSTPVTQTPTDNRPGFLKVVTPNSYAIVSVDGRHAFRTPRAKGYELPPGRHTVRLDHPEFISVSKTITIEPARDFQIKHNWVRRKRSGMMLLTHPQRLVVTTLSGKPLGVTGTAIEVQEGMHQVRVSRKGCANRKDFELEVVSAKTLVFNVPFVCEPKP